MNCEISYVDFTGKKLLKREALGEDQVVDPEDQITLDKLCFFSTEIAFGTVTLEVQIDDSVSIPDVLANINLVGLSFSKKFETPDLTYDTTGVSQTLSFNGTDFKVFVPWGAVRKITSLSRKIYRDWSTLFAKTVVIPSEKKIEEPEPPRRA